MQRRHGFCTKMCEMLYLDRGRAPRSRASEDATVVTHSALMRKVTRGRREDLGDTFFRSAYEANVARFFRFCGLPWTYEPRKFVFTGYTTAPVCYTPDFEVEERGKTWIVEVKGHWRGSDRQKLRRLKKQYPEEFSRLWVVSRWPNNEKGRRNRALLQKISMTLRMTDYTELERLAGVIPHWESR